MSIVIKISAHIGQPDTFPSQEPVPKQQTLNLWTFCSHFRAILSADSVQPLGS